MTMAEWKAMSMSVMGGVVPIVRCFSHDPVLNIGFDGKFFESQIDWERDFTNKVNLADLTPAALRLRALEFGGEATKDLAALERLRQARALPETAVSKGELTEAQKRTNRELGEKLLALAEQANQFPKDYPNSGRLAAARSCIATCYGMR